MKLPELASKGMFETKGKISQHYYNLLLKSVLAPTSTNKTAQSKSQSQSKTAKPTAPTAPKATTTRRVGRFTIEDEKDGGGVGGDEMAEYKGGSYKVHQGPKGGRFIRVKGNKVYLVK